MLHTLHYQESSNTLFWSQVKSNLNFTNECNVKLIYFYSLLKSIFKFKTDLYLNKPSQDSVITWCMAYMLHYVLVNVYILIKTHKASLKCITELSSVYFRLKKSDQI